MDCNYTTIKTCELKGSTFRSHLLNFGDFDISEYTFSAGFSNGLGQKLNDVQLEKFGNTVILPLTVLEGKSGNIRADVWMEKDGNRDLAVRFDISVSDKDCGCSDTTTHDITITYQELVIPVTVTPSVVNINLDYEAADQAAANANEAAISANQAAGSAQTAANEATQAASGATEAATSANTAAGFATSATQEAATATGQATAAASSANSSATAANSAATLANDKAALAQTAATNANTARDAANTAAQNALISLNLGFLTPSSPAAPATGIHRGQASEAGTYTNFKDATNASIIVTAGDLDIVNGAANYRVIIEVKNGVASKYRERVKGDAGGTNSIINVTAEYPLTAGNYYTFSTATAAVPSNRRTAGAIVTYQTAIDNWETATFTGTVAQWFEKARWVTEKISHSKINLVTSNAIESTRRTIRAKVEAGKSYMISNKVTFDGLYTSGYYDATGVKLGEIFFNTFPVQFYPVTSRYYKLLGTKAPVNAVEVVIVFASDTDNTEFMVEEAKSLSPSFYEHPVINGTYVIKDINDKAMLKKVENISQLPETVISSKNLYNPYTRLSVKQNTDGTIQYTSDFIEVEEGAQYYYTRPATLNTSHYQVFDANKVLTRAVLYPYVTIGVGEKYVKLLQVNGTTDTTATNQAYEKLNTPIQLEKSKRPTAYEPRFQLADYQIKTKLPKKYQFEIFTDKRCYVLGDSITNAGYWTTPFNDELKFSYFGRLGQDGAEWTNIDGDNNSIKERIDQLETSVVTNGTPDIVIIALGTNDWGNNRAIGDYATTMAKSYADVSARITVFDAIKYGVTRLKKLYPNAFIVIATPVQRLARYNTEYIDAIIAGGRMMATPVIDVYSNSGVVAYDEWASAYFQDGLHETALGGQVHGRYVANELLNLYYKT